MTMTVDHDDSPHTDKDCLGKWNFTDDEERCNAIKAEAKQARKSVEAQHRAEVARAEGGWPRNVGTVVRWLSVASIIIASMIYEPDLWRALTELIRPR
jgi:hypothetical protein